MSIPTSVAYPTTITLNRLSLEDVSSIVVTTNALTAQLIAAGWTEDPLYASVLFTLNLPLIPNELITIFSIYMGYFEGFTFQAFNPGIGEADPSGHVMSGYGPGGSSSIVVGVLVDNAFSQTQLINALITAMNGSQTNWVVSGTDIGGFYGTFQQLLITASVTNPGPAANNTFMNGEALGGGAFIGAPAGGGYVLTSVATPTNAAKMRVILDTQPFIDNLRVTMNFDGVEIPGAFTHSPGAFYCNFKPNMNSVATPYSWAFFHDDDGMPYTPRNNSELFFGGDCFYMCNPRVDAALLVDPISPIGYCGFYTWGSAQPPLPGAGRDVMRESFKCYTRINNTDTNGPFSAFQVDCGVNWYTINSMYHAAGELDTTAGKSIQTSSLVGLSIAHNGPLKIIGDCWGMFLETRWYPLDTLAKTPDDSHTIRAYRSQTVPCEATLWMAID